MPVLPFDQTLAAGGALGDTELLALALRVTPAKAERLLRAFGSLSALAQGGLDELTARGRLTEAHALRLKAALELGRRAVDEPLRRGVSLENARAVQAHLRARLTALTHEELHVLVLDGQCRLLTHFVAAQGGANQVFAHPREVFARALRESATGVILVHNHPSGIAQPSDEDIDLTGKMMEAAGTLGLQLHDHVVLARSGLYSFAESGHLLLGA